MDSLSKSLSPNVWATSQISTSDMGRLAEAGFGLMICHRPDGEEIHQQAFAQIADAASAAGIKAVHIPIIGLPSLQAVEATGRALAAMGPNNKALLYCRSGMRSAAAWAMAERLRGVDADELRAAAAAAGYDLSRLPL